MREHMIEGAQSVRPERISEIELTGLVSLKSRSAPSSVSWRMAY